MLLPFTHTACTWLVKEGDLRLSGNLPCQEHGHCRHKAKRFSLKVSSYYKLITDLCLCACNSRGIARCHWWASRSCTQRSTPLYSSCTLAASLLSWSLMRSSLIASGELSNPCLDFCLPPRSLVMTLSIHQTQSCLPTDMVLHLLSKIGCYQRRSEVRGLWNE